MTDETDFLKYRRAELEAAEQALVKARENMRRTAEHHDLPRKGLFADSLFVWRSTAESWMEEARREGDEKGFKEALKGFEVLFNAGLITVRASRNSPFAHLGRGMSMHDAEAAADRMLAELVSKASKRAPRKT
jgi:hypothetical protein